VIPVDRLGEGEFVMSDQSEKIHDALLRFKAKRFASAGGKVKPSVPERTARQAGRPLQRPEPHNNLAAREETQTIAF
jgi:hypothetical protein